MLGGESKIRKERALYSRWETDTSKPAGKEKLSIGNRRSRGGKASGRRRDVISAFQGSASFFPVRVGS